MKIISMTFKQALNSVFKNWLNVRGRARRAEYWYFALFNALCYMVLLLLLVMATALQSVWMTIAVACLFFAFILIMLIPAFTLSVRRFHDVGISGKWFVAAYIISLSISIYELNETEPTVPTVISLLAGLACLVVSVMDSVRGSNKWGENPKGIEE